MSIGTEAKLAPETEQGTEESVKNLAGKYLTFYLAKEQFGLPILKVREIIGVMKITSIPNAASYIRGVINLRGKIVPVMDLREKLHLCSVEQDRRNCIIVTEIKSDEGDYEIGLLVDSVSEVLDINENEIEPPPMMGAGVDTGCILGMAQSGQNVKILLDVQKIVLDMNSIMDGVEAIEENEKIEECEESAVSV
ncbi:MAG: chemotaxis protein CheW [Gimesia sp.]